MNSFAFCRSHTLHRLYNSRRRCLDQKSRKTPNCYYPHRLTHFPHITAPTFFYHISPSNYRVFGNMAMCRRPSCVWCQRDGFSYDKCRQSLTVQLSLAKPFTFRRRFLITSLLSFYPQYPLHLAVISDFPSFTSILTVPLSRTSA